MAFRAGIPKEIFTHVRRVASNPAAAFRNRAKAGSIWQLSTAGQALRYDESGTVREIANLDGTQTFTNKTFTAPAITTPTGLVVAQEALFTQVAGNKVHTAAFAIPAGATILDVLITNTVLWNSGTSATLKAGLVDDDCFFIGMRLDSGVMAAGLTANFAWTAAFQGASIPALDGGGANDALGAANGLLYNAAAQTLNVIVTDVNVAGTNGRTRATVLYSLPASVIAPTVV